jgi:hypothetical protein
MFIEIQERVALWQPGKTPAFLRFFISPFRSAKGCYALRRAQLRLTPTKTHTIPSLYLLFIASWSVTAAAELVYFVKIHKTQMSIFRSDTAA